MLAKRRSENSDETKLRLMRPDEKRSALHHTIRIVAVMVIVVLVGVSFVAAVNLAF